MLGTGNEPFRVGHSPAASECYLEHSTPTRRGNVAGAIGGIADVVLEACKCHCVVLQCEIAIQSSAAAVQIVMMSILALPCEC